jgi:hypothetical protein
MDARKLHFSLWTDKENKWILDEVGGQDGTIIIWDLEVDLMTHTHYTCFCCKNRHKILGPDSNITRDMFYIVANPEKYLQEDEGVVCVYCIRYQLSKVKKLVDDGYVVGFYRKSYKPERCIYNKKYGYLIPLGSHCNSLESLVHKRATKPHLYDPFYQRNACLFDILLSSLQL